MNNQQFLQQAPNLVLAKKMKIAAWVVSAVVLLLVGMMRRYKLTLPDGWDLSFLPPLHALLNGLAAVALVLALYHIKRLNIRLHQRFIYIAIGLSVLFLLSYVAYHFTTPETLYGDYNGDKIVDDTEKIRAGGMRTIYLFILFSHIVFAAVSFPFILFTFIYAYTNQFNKHRKMARYVFPIWLYVAVTGPVVYLLLKPFYGI